ncbi:putative potassium transport system protein kup 1, partial [Clarias magur]
ISDISQRGAEQNLMSSQWDFLFLMFAPFLDVMASQKHLFKAHVVAQRLIGVLNHPWFEGLHSTRLSFVKGNTLDASAFCLSVYENTAQLLSPSV